MTNNILSKNILFITAVCMLAFFVFLLTGCKEEMEIEEMDDRIEVEGDLKMQLLGEWEWVKSTGGFGGNALQTPLNTGQTRRVIFTDKIYTEYRDSLVFETEYRLVRSISRPSYMDKELYIEINGFLAFAIKASDATLEMDQTLVDSYSHFYER